MAIVGTSQPAGRIDRVVHMLEALADRSRLLIVSELSRGPMSVKELVTRLPMAQSTVSVQLGVLYRSGLVSLAVKRNQRIYSLAGITALRMIATVRRFIAAIDQQQSGSPPSDVAIESTY